MRPSLPEDVSTDNGLSIYQIQLISLLTICSRTRKILKPSLESRSVGSTSSAQVAVYTLSKACMEIGWIKARMEDPSWEAGILCSCIVGKEEVSAYLVQ